MTNEPKKESKYKDTLNLPKTDFPMRPAADMEKRIQEQWFKPHGISDLLHVCNCGTGVAAPCRLHNPLERKAWDESPERLLE